MKDVRERALPDKLYVPTYLGAAGSVINCALCGGSYPWLWHAKQVMLEVLMLKQSLRVCLVNPG